ncbi:MAG: hypothetical protein U9R21_07045 [Candidatus Thermoplasmatota archaeon]|nr:hypothetical protein [Candidatus Thermoplasmatota archaeon]
MKGKKSNKTEKKKRRDEKVNIKDTDAWKRAEWDYADILSRNMLPSFLGDPLTEQEIIEWLNDILEGCPEFYPALFDLGGRVLKEGNEKLGKKYLDEGLRLMEKHDNKEELITAYYDTCEFLEKQFQFETAIEYYTRLEKIEKDKAKVYDCLSYCYVYLDDFDKAFHIQKKALESCDTNNKYFSNMGWIELLRGNIDNAKKMLDRSLKLDPNDEFTQGNIKMLTIIQKNKDLKNWENALLRKKDHEYLDRLEDEDEDEYQKQIIIDNYGKLDAFKFDLLRNSKYTQRRKYDIWFTAGYILDFIERTCDDIYFSYDDVGTVEFEFKSIMHRFIIKTGDIDEGIFNDVYTSLFEFYRFLSKHKVTSGYRSLKDEMLGVKEELLDKMDQWGEIRHNDEYTREEKEELREELFGSDGFWQRL